MTGNLEISVIETRPVRALVGFEREERKGGREEADLRVLRDSQSRGENEGRGERARAFWWAETELGRGVGWLRPAGGRLGLGRVPGGFPPPTFFFFPKHFLNRILCAIKF